VGRNNRSDAEYEIGGLTKGIKVLEALEGRPVTIETVIERTEFSYNIAMRCLKTLRLNGWATQLDDGKWTVGKRFIRYAGSVARQAGVLT
jgi:DNA-binding IclR family transcriptional regulator